MLLETYTPVTVDGLSEEDLAYLRVAASGFTITRNLAGTGFSINPNQYVGLLTLPSGAEWYVRPRVGAHNLLYMLNVAYRLPITYQRETAGVQVIAEAMEAFAAWFCRLVEERLVAGLYRSYVDVEENLRVLRGRLAFAEDVRRNVGLHHRMWCEYAEYSWDVPENQVVHQVARIVAGWPLRRDELRRRVRRVASDLGEVSLGRFYADDLRRFVYNRLNDSYRSVHRVCELILRNSSVHETAGSEPFATFLINMNDLFEQFVTQALQDRVAAPLRVRAQVPMALDVDGRVRMQPDLVVDSAGRNAMVADCKYKRLQEGEYKNNDVYQVLAYATSLRVVRGMLIYPSWEDAQSEPIVVTNPEKTTIEMVKLNLGGTVEEVERECDALAERVRAMARAAA